MEEDNLIRNFSIIAHIDHGKSTLADRLIGHTGALEERDQKDQFLDNMDLERERGITIKAQTVCLNYKSKNGKTYKINLIDTPGHVDFTYEVSRSLFACEGSILVVDASQGVEAQTIANVYQAIDQDHEIITVLNKIDLASAEPDRVAQEIEDIIGIDATDAIHASAKENIGTTEILEAIVEKVPPPKTDSSLPLRALIFDSWYDPYKGVIFLIRVVDGKISKNDQVMFKSNGKYHQVETLGKNMPFPVSVDTLEAGEVGFVIASIKDVSEVKVGDTVVHKAKVTPDPLPGFKEIKPVVFCGLYPIDSGDFDTLRTSLEKLKLNDASIHFEPETSTALGFGFRCGFLGLLHMEIIQERLEREYNLGIITTAPSVVYRVTRTDGNVEVIENPSDLGPASTYSMVEEPYIKATMLLPPDYIGAVIQLMQEKRSIQKNIYYITTTRVMLEYEVPLAEIVTGFYDRLKSATKGYASFDYEFIGYRASDLVKLEIQINKEPVDALNVIVHKDSAYNKGRLIVDKLQEVIPRQMFDIAIQAALGNKIIASAKVKAFRKNVTAKCYGGDITRKRKLLEKQKEGKKRMKQLGSVDVPQEAFLSVLKIGEK